MGRRTNVIPTLERGSPEGEASLPQVPGYAVLGRLGRGGMGVVYRARQLGLNRLVALKMILAGAQAEPAERARFHAEAETLARLRHPNIVQIYEVGEAGGCPYFALEYVEGGSVAQKLAGKPQPARLAARLVETLARAVHHAHQQGVVHRDLKASNVLLSLEGVPKVIDFGLAKWRRESVAGTATETVRGTPSYMAPEQAADHPVAVGPAADVYALGAILYELLTGRPPFLAETALAALLQVRTLDPVPPRRLQPGVPRDLETVCLKCLHKEPAKRYATAEDLAEDLRRFQSGEPIVARPTGLVEGGLKWARRRPTLAALANLTVLLLVGGMVGGLWYAARQRDRADQEKALRHLAEKAEQQAKDQEVQAREEREKAIRAEADARAVLAFFKDQVLAAARPESQDGGLGVHTTIRAAVDAAEPKIAGAFRDRPLVEASIRYTLGVTYLCLRESKAAVEQCERALQLRREQLGPDDRATLTSMNDLAMAYKDAGQLDKALPLLEQTLEKYKENLGREHPHTLTTMSNLANLYRAVGRLDEAITLHEEALKGRQVKLGPDRPETIASMNNLAVAYLAKDQVDKALPLFEQTLAKFKETLGPEHPHTLSTLNGLAMAYKHAAQLDKAIPLLEQTLAKRRAKLTADHPDTLTTMNNLAHVYQEAGQLDKALPLFEQTLAKRTEKLGPAHPETLTSMNNLARAHQADGRLDKALPLYEETLAKFQAKLGPEHPDTLSSMANLAVAYLATKQPDKGLALFNDCLAAHRQRRSSDPRRLGGTLALAGRELLKYGYYAEAEKMLREALTIREAKLADDWTTFLTQSQLGASLLRQKRYAEAERLLAQGYEGMKAREKAIPPQAKMRLVEALERLVQLYDAAGKADEAAKWRQAFEAARSSLKAGKP